MQALQHRITLSTWLTLSRITATPFVVYCMFASQWKTAFGLFIAAAITDALDGFLARILQQQTYLGSVLDPLADKLLITSTCATMAYLHFSPLGIPWTLVGLLVARELCIIGGFAFLYFQKKYITVAPTLSGKLSTLINSTLIVTIFICHFFGWNPLRTYTLLVTFAAFLLIFSLLEYARIAYTFYRKKSS